MSTLTGSDQRVNEMKNSRKETTGNEDQLFALEEHLADTLKPITPPSELVQRLFLVFGGVMSVFVVIVTIARAFFYFVGRK